MDNFFSNWTIYDNETTTDYPFSNFTTEANYTEIPNVQNSLKGVDENAIIIELDKYPHVNYDDYGFPEDEVNQTFYEPTSSTGPENSTEPTYATVKGIVFDTEDKEDAHTTSMPNSCDGRLVRCYERICENKTFTSENFSGLCEKIFQKDVDFVLVIDDFS